MKEQNENYTNYVGCINNMDGVRSNCLSLLKTHFIMESTKIMDLEHPLGIE
ncbi:hypothetical protein JHK86_017105 [Glycine max]|nr:hypothetical protein JHK86_017105 [Glycine max]